MKKERLVIIDGHALIHRAYHAIPPLTTTKGETVNAVYGFTSILLNVIRDLEPKYIIVAFDLPGKTKRHEEYADYKANRSAAPDDLIPQFRITKELLSAFNISSVDRPGYEADDVIGTIVKNAPKNIEKYIVTGDLDELQLVDDSTKVYTMKRGFSDVLIYDEKKVKERYQISPKQFVDYKALRGDPSDNIPGVRGIGEKTAIELIKSFGSLDKIYQNIHKIRPALAKKLVEEKEMAYLSQKLAKIEKDLEIKIDLNACLLSNIKREKALKKFQELGFKSLISRLPKNSEKSENKDSRDSHQKNCDYKTISKLDDLRKLARTLGQKKVFAIDTETTSVDQIEAKLVGISISFSEKCAYYIPIGHLNTGDLVNIDKKSAIKILKPILENKNILKVGHNLKYDYVILKKEGISLNGPYFDTMIAAFLVNPTLRAQKLSALAFSELGLEKMEIETLIGSGASQITFDKVPIKEGAIYAAEDADVALRLYGVLLKKLSQKDLLELAKRIEFPLIPILGQMELTGIKIDKKKLEKLSIQIKKRVRGLEKKIFELAGEEFNIASPSQLQRIFFEKIKIHKKLSDPKDLKKLKTGGFSTAASELEKLRGKHEIVDDIFSFRELSKLLNTYVDVLPSLAKKDNRVHTSYNQTITQTGRLSSSNPNLQNIPTRTQEGRNIKSSFVASPGMILLSADYSQIELRVIAHIAKDENMIKIFNSGRDIHTETAAGIYNVSEGKVTNNMRRAAKIVNFGIIYGVSAHGLHQQIGISREEGQELISRYFELHPKIKEYSDKMIAMAKELGYVETAFGRKRFLPEINSKNYMIRAAAERMAINMPVQGTAADLMKLAMIDIEKDIKNLGPNTKMLLQVHDELIFEVLESDVQRIASLIKEKMNHVATLLVPIETEVHWGKNWGEIK